MKWTVITASLLCYSWIGCAQTNSDSLLQEVTTTLQKGSATVSDILTNKKYLSLHPATVFRGLIQTHCNSSVLKITTADEPGKKIRVLGTVTNKEGRPVAGALVYLYQTDAKGWYAADAPHVLQNEGDMRHARLFGYVKTDANGRFELHTVKPSGYPGSDLPAHIHVHISASGYRSVVTEFLFDDDERLVGDIRENAVRHQFLVARPEKTTAPFDQQFTYRINLEKH